MLDFVETRSLACIRPVAGCHRMQHCLCQQAHRL